MIRAASDDAWRSGCAYLIHDDLGAITPRAARIIASVLPRYSRLEQVPLSPDARNLLEVARRLLANASGTTEHTALAGQPPLTHDEDAITTSAAAKELGVSREYVGRLALSGRLGSTGLAGGRRMVSRAEVLAFKAERTRER